MPSSLRSPSSSSSHLPLSSPALSSIHSNSQEGVDGEDSESIGDGPSTVTGAGSVRVTSRSSASVRRLSEALEGCQPLTSSGLSRPTQVYHHDHQSHDEGDRCGIRTFTETPHAEGRCLFSRSFASSVRDADSGTTVEGADDMGKKGVRSTTVTSTRLLPAPPTSSTRNSGGDVANAPSNNININHNANLQAKATASVAHHHPHRHANGDHRHPHPISHPPPSAVASLSFSLLPSSATVDETPARVLYPSRAASAVSSQQQCSQQQGSQHQRSHQGPSSSRGRGGGSRTANGLLFASRPARCNLASSTTSAGTRAHHTNKGLLFGLGNGGHRCPFTTSIANHTAVASERGLGTRCFPSLASQRPPPPPSLLAPQPSQAPTRGATGTSSQPPPPRTSSTSIASLFYEQYCEATRPSHLLRDNREYHGSAGVLDTALVGIDVSGGADRSDLLDTSRHVAMGAASGNDTSVCLSSYSLHMSFLDALVGGGQGESGRADGDSDCGEALADVSLLSGGCEWGDSNANNNAVLPAPFAGQQILARAGRGDGVEVAEMVFGPRRNDFSRCPAPRLARSSAPRHRHASARKDAPSPAKQPKLSGGIGTRWSRNGVAADGQSIAPSPSTPFSTSAASTALNCRASRSVKKASALSHRQRTQQLLLIGAVDRLLSSCAGDAGDDGGIGTKHRTAVATGRLGPLPLQSCHSSSECRHLPVGTIGSVCCQMTHRRQHQHEPSPDSRSGPTNSCGGGGAMMVGIVAAREESVPPPRLGSGAANDHSPLTAACVAATGSSRSSGGDAAAISDDAHALRGGRGDEEGCPNTKKDTALRASGPAENIDVPLPFYPPPTHLFATSAPASAASVARRPELHRDDTDVDGDGADRARTLPYVAALYNCYLERQSRRLRGAWLQ